MPGPSSSPADRTRRLGGRYRLDRPLASGGMAEVWEATDEVLTRNVAVKLLHPHLAADASFVARFRGEAINAARLSHPSIVSVYDTWSGDGSEAIIMELVRGTTLRHLLDGRGPLDVDEALAVTDHIAAALEAAHAAGIVHRDIKPANVLLSTEGRVLVTDFGIAKATEGHDLTTESAMIGTAKYLSPEQVEGGPVDGRTDLYALGVVLFEMLTGEVPFRGDTEVATALARLHRDPDPPGRRRPGLPPTVDAVVLRCLARDPAGRPASATELRSEVARVRASLARASAGPPDDGGPAEVVDGAPDRRRRHRLVPAVAVAALLLGAAAVAAAVTARGDDPTAVRLAGVAAYDPLGSPAGEENNASAILAADGDTSTAWTTETYRDPEAMAGKAGVGLVLELDSAVPLEALDVTGPSAGWDAQVYVTQGTTPTGLDGWGPPVAGAGALTPGTTTFSLGGTVGDRVLLWITRTGTDGRVEVAEVRVRGG